MALFHDRDSIDAVDYKSEQYGNLDDLEYIDEFAYDRCFKLKECRVLDAKYWPKEDERIAQSFISKWISRIIHNDELERKIQFVKNGDKSSTKAPVSRDRFRKILPRKWPQMPGKVPRLWKEDAELAERFCKHMAELEMGTLVCEPIDVDGFVNQVSELIDSNDPLGNVALVALMGFGIQMENSVVIAYAADEMVKRRDSRVVMDGGVVAGLMLPLLAGLPKKDRFHQRSLVKQYRLEHFQFSNKDAVACDDGFLYVFSACGMFKYGTGNQYTVASMLYLQSNKYSKAMQSSKKWMCCIGKYLYCRTSEMPAYRVDKVCCEKLELVQELQFQSYSDRLYLHASKSFPMVTDGKFLYTVRCDTRHVDVHKRVSKKKKDTTPKKQNAVVGNRVMRGSTWIWGNQDGGVGNFGTIRNFGTWPVGHSASVHVAWDVAPEKIYVYRWQEDIDQDIVLVENANHASIVVCQYDPSQLVFISETIQPEALTPILERVLPLRDVQEDDIFLTKLHIHPISISSSTTAWLCDGNEADCIGGNVNPRYRCTKGCDFDLCDACLDSSEILDTDMDMEQSNVPSLEISGSGLAKPVLRRTTARGIASRVGARILGQNFNAQLHNEENGTQITVKFLSSTEVGSGGMFSSTGNKVLNFHVVGMEDEWMELLQQGSIIANIPNQIGKPFADKSKESMSSEAKTLVCDSMYSLWNSQFSKNEILTAMQKFHMDKNRAAQWLQTSVSNIRNCPMIKHTKTIDLQYRKGFPRMDASTLSSCTCFTDGKTLQFLLPPTPYRWEMTKEVSCDIHLVYDLASGLSQDSKKTLSTNSLISPGSPCSFNVATNSIVAYNAAERCILEFSTLKSISNAECGEFIQQLLAPTFDCSINQITLYDVGEIVQNTLFNLLQCQFVLPIEANIVENLSRSISKSALRQTSHRMLKFEKSRLQRKIKVFDRRIICFQETNTESEGKKVAFVADCSSSTLSRIAHMLHICIACKEECHSRTSLQQLSVVLAIVDASLTIASHDEASLVCFREYVLGTLRLHFEFLLSGALNQFEKSQVDCEVLHGLQKLCGNIVLQSIQLELVCETSNELLRVVQVCIDKSLKYKAVDVDHFFRQLLLIFATCKPLCKRISIAILDDSNIGVWAQLLELSRLSPPIHSKVHHSKMDQTPIIQFLQALHYSILADVALWNKHSNRIVALFSLSVNHSIMLMKQTQSVQRPHITHSPFLEYVLPIALASIASLDVDNFDGLLSIVEIITLLVNAVHNDWCSDLLPDDQTIERKKLLQSEVDNSVIIESPHPYGRGQVLKRTIKVAGATRLSLEFDKRCETVNDSDCVSIFRGTSQKEKIPSLSCFGPCLNSYGELKASWSHAPILVKGDTATVVFNASTKPQDSRHEKHRWGIRCRISGVFTERCTLKQKLQTEVDSIYSKLILPLLQGSLPKLSELSCGQWLGATSLGSVVAARYFDSLSDRWHEYVRIANFAFEEFVGKKHHTIATQFRALKAKALRSWDNFRQNLMLVILFGSFPGFLSMTFETFCAVAVQDNIKILDDVGNAVSRIMRWVLRMTQVVKECYYISVENTSFDEFQEEYGGTEERLQDLCDILGINTKSKKQDEALSAAFKALQGKPYADNSVTDCIVSFLDSRANTLALLLGCPAIGNAKHSVEASQIGARNLSSCTNSIACQISPNGKEDFLENVQCFVKSMLDPLDLKDAICHQHKRLEQRRRGMNYYFSMLSSVKSPSVALVGRTAQVCSKIVSNSISTLKWTTQPGALTTLGDAQEQLKVNFLVEKAIELELTLLEDITLPIERKIVFAADIVALHSYSSDVLLLQRIRGTKVLLGCLKFGLLHEKQCIVQSECNTASSNGYGALWAILRLHVITSSKLSHEFLCSTIEFLSDWMDQITSLLFATCRCEVAIRLLARVLNLIRRIYPKEDNFTAIESSVCSLIEICVKLSSQMSTSPHLQLELLAFIRFSFNVAKSPSIPLAFVQGLITTLGRLESILEKRKALQVAMSGPAPVGEYLVVIHPGTKILADDWVALLADEGDPSCEIFKGVLSYTAVEKTVPEMPDNGPANVLHRGVRCDECDSSPLHGARYTCDVCKNYDLCAECYNGSAHNLDHGFSMMLNSHAMPIPLRARSNGGMPVAEKPAVGTTEWKSTLLMDSLTRSPIVFQNGCHSKCLALAKRMAARGALVSVESKQGWSLLKKLDPTLETNCLSLFCTSLPGPKIASGDPSFQLEAKTMNFHIANCCDNITSSDLSMINQMLCFQAYELLNFLLTSYSYKNLVQTKLIGACHSLSAMKDSSPIGALCILGGAKLTLQPGCYVEIITSCSNHPGYKGFVTSYVAGSSSVELALDTSEKYPYFITVHPGDVRIIHQLADVDCSVAKECASAIQVYLKSFFDVQDFKKTIRQAAHDCSVWRAMKAFVELLRYGENSVADYDFSFWHALVQQGTNCRTDMSLELIHQQYDVHRENLWELDISLHDKPCLGRSIIENESLCLGDVVVDEQEAGVNREEFTIFHDHAYKIKSASHENSSNKLLLYWEKHVIPVIQKYVRGSFKSYEMDYFFAQLREPLREGNQQAAIKIAYTLCDGHIPTDCQFPDPNMDWNALQIEEIVVGRSYVIQCCSTGWVPEMMQTVGSVGFATAIRKEYSLVLLQVKCPVSYKWKFWWYHVHCVAPCVPDSLSKNSSLEHHRCLKSLHVIQQQLFCNYARAGSFSLINGLMNDKRLDHLKKRDLSSLFKLAVDDIACPYSPIGTIMLKSNIMPHQRSLYPCIFRPSQNITILNLFISRILSTTSKASGVPTLHGSDNSKLIGEKHQCHKAIRHEIDDSKISTKPSKATTLLDSLPSMLLKTLLHDFEVSLVASARYSSSTAMVIQSDNDSSEAFKLEIPGASFIVVSFAEHPVLMCLPPGSSLAFYLDPNCTNLFHMFSAQKVELTNLSSIVLPGNKCWVVLQNGKYARYKFSVWAADLQLNHLLWTTRIILDYASIVHKHTSREDVLQRIIASCVDYLFTSSCPAVMKELIFKRLIDVVNSSMAIGIDVSHPVKKILRLKDEALQRYQTEIESAKGLFSPYVQNLVEVVALAEHATLRNTAKRNANLSAANAELAIQREEQKHFTASPEWWTQFQRCASFATSLSSKCDQESTWGRLPRLELKQLWEQLVIDHTIPAMIVVHCLPRCSNIEGLKTELCNFIKQLLRDLTDGSASENAMNVLNQEVGVVDIPKDTLGFTLGYAFVRISKPYLALSLCKQISKTAFKFEGECTSRDIALDEYLSEKEGDTSENDNANRKDLICHACTFENEQNWQHCAVCGSDCPIDHVAEAAAVSEVRGESESVDGWQCTACTFINDWEEGNCCVCEAPCTVSRPTESDDIVNLGNSSSNEVKHIDCDTHTLVGYPFETCVEAGNDIDPRIDLFLKSRFINDELNTVQPRLYRTLEAITREYRKASRKSTNDDIPYAAFPMLFKNISAYDRAFIDGDTLVGEMADVARKDVRSMWHFLVENGYDMNCQKTHFRAFSECIANQCNWTVGMDVSLIAACKLISRQFGIPALLDFPVSLITKLNFSRYAHLHPLLLEQPIEGLRMRFYALKSVNTLWNACLPLFDLSNRSMQRENTLSSNLRSIRQLIFNDVKQSFITLVLDNTSMVGMKRPVVVISRLPANYSSTANCMSDNTMFEQLYCALNNVPNNQLCPPRPAGAADPMICFEVVLKGENVVGEGGPYRQIFDAVAMELKNGVCSLFLPTANKLLALGSHRDKLIPSPGMRSAKAISEYEFIGKLMGCCIRSGVRLSLDFPPLFWKKVVGQDVDRSDLKAIDAALCDTLDFIEAADATVLLSSIDQNFVCVLSDGSESELVSSGKKQRISISNRHQFIRLTVAKRLCESDIQIKAIVRGLSQIVPDKLLSLYTWQEIQNAVCGSRIVDIQLLKRHTKYSEGLSVEECVHLQHFWSVLEDFSEEEKRHFIRFAWGQERLPGSDAEFDEHHTRLLVKSFHLPEGAKFPSTWTTQQKMDSMLPKADTCFFNIELPLYSTKAILRKKLLQAISYCISMDADSPMEEVDDPTMILELE